METYENETITKAGMSAQFLVNDIREAHKLACNYNPFLEMLLVDLIEKAAWINNRLEQIRTANGQE